MARILLYLSIFLMAVSLPEGNAYKETDKVAHTTASMVAVDVDSLQNQLNPDDQPGACNAIAAAAAQRAELVIAAPLQHLNQSPVRLKAIRAPPFPSFSHA
ncbi:MAG: hypothetical protein GYB33_17360 [Gammaproteobacteria bacterium]|nr:hypothetical protein [Gammaproteobacteria bacterium]